MRDQLVFIVKKYETMLSERNNLLAMISPDEIETVNAIECEMKMLQIVIDDITQIMITKEESA